MEIDWLNTADLARWRLAVDTAALVLIWLVQLVIYPVFAYLARTDFERWHPLYTRRVTLVVLPVMLSQLALYGLLLLTVPSGGELVNSLLVAGTWLITFFRAVPLHAALDEPSLADHQPASRQLIRVNWWRTGLWSATWLITVIDGFGR